MSSTDCLVCGRTLGAPIYSSAHARSVTSLGTILPVRTEVGLCRACGHLQTPPLARIGRFYRDEYRMLDESAEQDQLYELRDGQPVFRTDHEVDTLLARIDLPEGARVLDYGAAKGAFVRTLLARRPDLRAHLFDVTERYLPFWQRIEPRPAWAVGRPDPAWRQQTDLVVSFFVLEHVADPRAAAAALAELLRPGGRLHLVVPNAYANPGDLMVVDHVNHFSESSLARLLHDAGFAHVQIDAEAHRGAWLASARTEGAEAPPAGQRLHSVSGVGEAGAPHPGREQGSIAPGTDGAERIAAFWRTFGQRVADFERAVAGDRPCAIYGAGFYGTFLATCLRGTAPLRCFVDRDPHRSGRRLLDRPIVPPHALPPEVEVVYVGLNPHVAREAIAAVAEWRERQLAYFYP